MIPAGPPRTEFLIEACDQLHRNSDLDDGLWTSLTKHLSEMAIVEVLMLAGFYRTVSYLTNALRLPLETWAERFPPSLRA